MIGNFLLGYLLAVGGRRLMRQKWSAIMARLAAQRSLTGFTGRRGVTVYTVCLGNIVELQGTETLQRKGAGDLAKSVFTIALKIVRVLNPCGN